MIRALAAIAALGMLCACGSTGDRPVAQPSGPPSIRADAVVDHAGRFEAAARPAGSEQEQIAAVYITAHLQQAGYVVRLDGVPIRNTVRSTNVRAVGPGEGSPDVVVTAAYGTPEDDPGSPGPSRQSSGGPIALMLELARALRVSAPEARVDFVALGAEWGGEPRLGARRLARTLLDEKARPTIVELVDIDVAGERFAASGPGAAGLVRQACAGCVRGPAEAPPPDVFDAAGFDRIVVSGGAPEVGRILLEYLGAAPPVP